MKFLLFSLLFLSACQFHPLYRNQTYQSVCVQSIPEASGYLLYQSLTKRFPERENCVYHLKVTSPKFTLSDQGISNKDFITMQRIQATASYKLLDQKGNAVLSNSVMSDGSSAVVDNPYSTVVSVEKTQQNLIPILAEQISLHVGAFLDRNQQ